MSGQIVIRPSSREPYEVSLENLKEIYIYMDFVQFIYYGDRIVEAHTDYGEGLVVYE